MSGTQNVPSVKCPRCKVYATSLDPPTVQITGLVNGYRSRHCTVCEWQQWECMPHAEWLVYQHAEDARRADNLRAEVERLREAQQAQFLRIVAARATQHQEPTT